MTVIKVLAVVKEKYFSDPDGVECALPFHDTHGRVLTIFSELELALGGAAGAGLLASLLDSLTALTEDPVIRDELNPIYLTFLKEMSLKPTRKLQQCILSIL